MLAREDGIDLAIGGASWPTEDVEAAAVELGEGSSQPEQGKGAPTGGRLLAAEEVHVELAGRARRPRTRGPGRTGDARLADRRAGARLEDGPPGAGGGSTNCGTSLLLTSRCCGSHSSAPGRAPGLRCPGCSAPAGTARQAERCRTRGCSYRRTSLVDRVDAPQGRSVTFGHAGKVQRGGRFRRVVPAADGCRRARWRRPPCGWRCSRPH